MRSPGRPPIRRDVERAFWGKVAEGLISEDAAVAVGVSGPVGSRWFRERGGMPSIEFTQLSGRYLSFAEREELGLLRVQGSGIREIARQLGRSPSTISRELRRNVATRSAQLTYRASTAQCKAELMSKRPKAAILVANEKLRGYVQERLAGAVRASTELSSKDLRRLFGGAEANLDGRTGPGRRSGVRNRSRADCRSTSPTTRRCGSHMRPSIRRSMSKAEAVSAVSLWLTSGPDDHCEFRGHALGTEPEAT
jgi:hypothetical protein